MARRLDITGERYGRLTAISYVGVAKHNKTVWRFRCDCGVVVEQLLANVRKGAAVSCGCWKIERLKEQGSINRLSYGESSFNGLFAHYKNSAKYYRKGEWGISRDEFRTLTKGSCHYCGQLPLQVHRTQKNVYGEYLYNGIDRVDNQVGYVMSNVVSCCYVCNRAKHGMTQEEFLSWVDRISNFQENKRANMETEK